MIAGMKIYSCKLFVSAYIGLNTEHKKIILCDIYWVFFFECSGKLLQTESVIKGSVRPVCNLRQVEKIESNVRLGHLVENVSLFRDMITIHSFGMMSYDHFQVVRANLTALGLLEKQGFFYVYTKLLVFFKNETISRIVYIFFFTDIHIHTPKIHSVYISAFILLIFAKTIWRKLV